MGLTQVDVAGALGLAQGLVSKYETGDLLLHGELIVELARVLGVSADDILGIHSRRAKPALPAVDKTLARRLAQLQPFLAATETPSSGRSTPSSPSQPTLPERSASILGEQVTYAKAA